MHRGIGPESQSPLEDMSIFLIEHRAQDLHSQPEASAAAPTQSSSRCFTAKSCCTLAALTSDEAIHEAICEVVESRELTVADRAQTWHQVRGEFSGLDVAIDPCLIAQSGIQRLCSLIADDGRVLRVAARRSVERRCADVLLS